MYKLSDSGILISLFGLGPGRENEFCEKKLKPLLKHYRDESLKPTMSKYLTQSLGLSPISAKQKLEEELGSLYKPLIYSTFGEFDLAAIMVIDDMDILSRLSLIDMCRTQQFIFGSLPCSSEKLAHLFTDNKSNESRKKNNLIGIAQLKINSFYNIEYGNELMEPIETLILQHCGKKACGGIRVKYENEKEDITPPTLGNLTRIFIIDSLGWNEITLLMLSNNYSDIMQIFMDLKNTTFNDLQEALGKDNQQLPDPKLIERILSNSNSKYSNLHLFSATNLILGFKYSLFEKFLEKDFDLALIEKNLPPDEVDELKKCRVKPLTFIMTKPGHESELTRGIPPLFNTNEATTQGEKEKAIKIVYSGKENVVVTYPCDYFREQKMSSGECFYPMNIYGADCSDIKKCRNLNNYQNNKNPIFINFLELLSNLNKLRFSSDTQHHIFETKTNIGVEVDFEKRDIPPEHLRLVQFVREKAGFDFYEIKDMRDTLRKINISRNLISLFAHAFSIFNITAKDYACLDSYIELFPYLNSLKDYVNDFTILIESLSVNHNTNLKDIINDLNNGRQLDNRSNRLFVKWGNSGRLLSKALDYFHKAFTQRFSSGFYTQELTDITMYYKGGAQQILTCMDGFLNALLSGLVKEPQDQFGLTLISSVPEITVTNILGPVIEMNLFHLYQPERWVNLFHEIGHYLYFTKDEIFQLEIEELNKIKKILLEKPQYFADVLFKMIEEVFCDLFLFYFGFLGDKDLFFKHFWGYYFCRPHPWAEVAAYNYRFYLVLHLCCGTTINDFFKNWEDFKNRSPWRIDLNYKTFNKNSLHTFNGFVGERFGKNRPILDILESVKEKIEKKVQTLFLQAEYATIKDFREQNEEIANMFANLESGELYFNTDGDFFKFVVKLNYAYLKKVMGAVTDGKEFLQRDRNENLPLFNQNSGPLMWESLGTLFSSDPMLRKKYFLYRMTFLRSLWDSAMKNKSKILEKCLS